MTANSANESDLNQIVQLCWTYGKLLDTDDVDGFLELFVEDVEFTAQAGATVMYGRRELAEFLRAGIKWTSAGPRTHVMSNVVVEFDEDDPHRATGRTTGVAWLHTDAGKISTRGLHYDDVFVKLPEGWRFAKRSHNVDWEYQMPVHRVEIVGEPWDATAS